MYKNDAYIEVPRKKLIQNVSKDDSHLLLDIFMENPKQLLEQIKDAGSDKKKVMILSDPVCGGG